MLPKRVAHVVNSLGREPTVHLRQLTEAGKGQPRRKENAPRAERASPPEPAQPRLCLRPFALVTRQSAQLDEAFVIDDEGEDVRDIRVGAVVSGVEERVVGETGGEGTATGGGEARGAARGS